MWASTLWRGLCVKEYVHLDGKDNYEGPNMLHPLDADSEVGIWPIVWDINYLLYSCIHVYYILVFWSIIFVHHIMLWKVPVPAWNLQYVVKPPPQGMFC